MNRRFQDEEKEKRLEQLKQKVSCNPYSSNVTFLYPLKTSENLLFSDIFRGYRNVTLGEYGLSLKFVISFCCSLLFNRVYFMILKDLDEIRYCNFFSIYRMPEQEFTSLKHPSRYLHVAIST